MSGQIHRFKKERDFVNLDTHALRNPALSWKAKGLHSYLLQLPDNWQINIADLSNRSKDGRDGTAAGLTELIEAGYIIRQRVLNERKQFEGWDYNVFEQPKQAEDWLAVNGKTENGFSVNGKAENGKSVTNKKEEYQLTKKAIIKEEKDAALPLSPPFEETGETTDLDGTLEAQQPEPTSPGGGAIRVSITDPEHPDIPVLDIIEPKTDPPKNSRGKSKSARSGIQDEIELATRVIEHLNQTAGRSFRVNTGENAKGIIARHREGFTEAELLEVVEFKAGKWKSDPEMYEYLNPVTLFRPANFERYLQAARAIAPKPQQQTTRSSIQHFGNGDYSKKQAF